MRPSRDVLLNRCDLQVIGMRPLRDVPLERPRTCLIQGYSLSKEFSIIANLEVESLYTLRNVLLLSPQVFNAVHKRMSLSRDVLLNRFDLQVIRMCP